MTRTLLLVMAVGVAVLSSCGVHEGDACSPVGGATCADDSHAFWCHSSGFKEYACPGQLGCTSNSSGIVCDFRGSAVGDPCPFIVSGTIGFCSDTSTFITCDKDTGKWRALACSSCTSNGLAATCSP